MRRRILIGAATLEPGRGGIARVARMTARALIRLGHDVTLVSYLDRDPVEIDGVRSRPAGGSKLRFAMLCTRGALAAECCVYDHVGIARAHPALPGLRRPFAIWIYGLEAWEGMRPEHVRVVRGAAHVSASSRHTLDRFERHHGRLAAASVCWLATEQDEAPEGRATFDGPPTVMIVGRVDEGEGRKGHAELLDCWPRLLSAVPSARLVIVGGGSALTALEARVAALPFAASVEVRGHVPEPDMPELLRRAHVLAMPSRQEGFGIVYVEAMRFGLPVIASRHDAGQEVNVDGETGFNVDLDRDELAERLRQLLGDPALARRMGEAGARRWQRHFRFGCFAERLGADLGGFLGQMAQSKPCAA